MTSIADLLNQISVESQSNIQSCIQTQTTPTNVCLVLDVSGSTSQIFSGRKSVLTKEIEVMIEYILKTPYDNYELYSFDSVAYYHGKVPIMVDEGLVDLPNFRSGTATNTCDALNKILNNLNTFKPSKVVIFTDGQTSNSSNEFTNPMNQFKKNGIKMGVVAVSDMDKNLESITKNEESRIPGMEMVNMLGNSVDFLNIYNKHHILTPYVGISNSSINKNSILFMGIEVKGFVIKFIDRLLELLNENKLSMNWGSNLMDLKKMLSEIGKLLSILFVRFPVEDGFAHPFLEKICNKIYECASLINPSPTPPFDITRILKIIEYGFNCSKKDVPVIMTNFEEHVKESATKHNEFANALNMLNERGTGLNSHKKISIPYGNNAVCVLDTGSVELTQSLGEYPKSRDKFGNVYMGLDITPETSQAIRIGMRRLCEVVGFPNARGSASVIFYVLNQMSMMYLKGIDLECEHMKELRKIAVAQVSMEVMVAKNKYDGKGCWAFWKEGKQIPMHYSNTSTHTSLYTDALINPLGLTEPIWWALQMSMLGLFEEQKPYYAKTLEQLGIGLNLDDFLMWYRTNYSQMVCGSIGLAKTSQDPKSIFTLDDFEPDEEVYELKEHEGCKTKTWYSKTEIETYIMEGGCVWCKYKPLSTDLCKVSRESWSNSLLNQMKMSSPIRVINNSSNANSQTTIFDSFANLKVSSQTLDQENNLNRKYRINLIGITGSGKSTCAEKIKNYVEQRGGIVLIVSADKWSKQGFKGKETQSKILNEIRQFDKVKNNLKIVIMDMCNESGITTKSFGYDFSQYKDIVFYPNLNKEKFDQYEAWCLSNVLARPLHTPTTNYWLNPVSAGVQTCIKVHNMKASGVSRLAGVFVTSNFNENLSSNQIENQIQAKANQYANFLKTQNLDDQIDTLMTSEIQF